MTDIVTVRMTRQQAKAAADVLTYDSSEWEYRIHPKTAATALDVLVAAVALERAADDD